MLTYERLSLNRHGDVRVMKDGALIGHIKYYLTYHGWAFKPLKGDKHMAFGMLDSAKQNVEAKERAGLL